MNDQLERLINQYNDLEMQARSLEHTLDDEDAGQALIELNDLHTRLNDLANVIVDLLY
jgi:hypothetical protein